MLGSRDFATQDCFSRTHLGGCTTHQMVGQNDWLPDSKCPSRNTREQLPAHSLACLNELYYVTRPQGVEKSAGGLAADTVGHGSDCSLVLIEGDMLLCHLSNEFVTLLPFV